MKLLIIGKLPPPIGGVTIHVNRLIDKLSEDGFDYGFIKLDKSLLIKIFFLIGQFKVVHLHSSNIYVQLYLSIIFWLFNVKSIVTFHGDLNRFTYYKTILIKTIIKIIDVPIVLNQGSYNIAKKINDKSQLISAFIPPTINEELPPNIISKLSEAKNKYKKLYATNGYSLSYDKEKNEIYGILDLIKFFNNLTNSALFISDPSQEYIKYINQNSIFVNSNIYMISELHSFYEVLKYVDASIRNTSTDGDSLSIKESLFLNKITFATNVVSRPEGVIVYPRGEYNFDFDTFVPVISENLSGIKKLKEIYIRELQ
jgi:glycosyltransferase involved in cell wall biosynthesis